ncbi:t-SNARE domain-containing protein 1 [Thalassophryne amazonica]|uniref:t-SNARE domain-containing protein 1 n=1 Tax=Thalassophryne amazonica TaxID=390379 RepID=UPI001470CD3C|nr:t-SNARE domain-containing protein 1 [Thalassophryne amazonica]
MSYGSIDGSSFGSRNPFGRPTRQGYQPVATQVSSSELQDVFQETSSNIFQINANVVTLEKSLQSLGTSKDTTELRQILHSTQQQTNKVITSTSQLIKQLSDIISGSSRQDCLRLTRLKSELSESVQRYGELQKKIAERSRALLPPPQTEKKKSLQTPSSDQIEEGPMFGEAAGSVGGVQDFLSEISEEDVELLRQREEGLLQIEVRTQTPVIDCTAKQSIKFIS